MGILNNILLVAAGIALTLASLWFGNNHHLLPETAATEAELFDGLFNTTLVIATGIFLVVEGILIFCAFRFRKPPGDDTDGSPVEGNILLEVVWTAVPAVIVLWLAVDSFDVYQRMQTGSGILMLGHSHSHSAEVASHEASEQATHYQEAFTKASRPALEVEVTGMQYAWVFTYPETGVVSSELHVPAGERVILHMTAQDVNHAFWVPQFRLKQDLIAGRTTELAFTANKIGEYPIVCAELCGPYHGIMASQLIVEDPEVFATWQQQQVLAMKEHPQPIQLASSAFAEAHQHSLSPDVAHHLRAIAHH
ncbi:MAG: cytochrome c oxidase subunit II [Thermostichales cyanobacterium BF4_bins_65]